MAGGQRPTSKQRVRRALRVAEAADALAALKADPSADVLDEDGLTPKHWAVLRARGVDRQTYREIGLQLGVSVTTVSRLLNEALDRLQKVPAETMERVRAFDLALLDELQSIFMPRARAGIIAAGDILLRIQKSRQRMLGYAVEQGPDDDDSEIDVPTWTPVVADDALIDEDKALDAALAAAVGADGER